MQSPLAIDTSPVFKENKQIVNDIKESIELEDMRDVQAFRLSDGQIPDKNIINSFMSNFDKLKLNSSLTQNEP